MAFIIFRPKILKIFIFFISNFIVENPSYIHQNNRISSFQNYFIVFISIFVKKLRSYSFLRNFAFSIFLYSNCFSLNITMNPVQRIAGSTFTNQQNNKLEIDGFLYVKNNQNVEKRTFYWNVSFERRCLVVEGPSLNTLATDM